MKLHKDKKPSMVIPVKTHLGFYRCVCGNRLVEYRCQKECEICKARLNWDEVDVTPLDEKNERVSAKGYIDIDYTVGRNKR